jgi:hypothetical protein
MPSSGLLTIILWLHAIHNVMQMKPFLVMHVVITVLSIDGTNNEKLVVSCILIIIVND